MKYIVYTKNNCPNCVQAKNILKMKGIDYSEENVDEDENLKVLLIEAGAKTMPQIYNVETKEFVPNGHLGLLRLMREGKL